MELLELYYDVLIQILEEVEPEDLAALAQTSWAFNRFIKDNTVLYKAHYLKNFDDPRRTPTDAEPDWISALQRFVRCRKVFQSQNEDYKNENFRFVVETVNNLISSGSEHNGESLNRIELTKLFDSPLNADSFLYRSSLYSIAGTDAQKQASNEDDRQFSAKIHSLYGIPNTPSGRRTLSIHPYARARVYDLRRYTKHSRWGPFRNDDSMRVDWETIESIMMLLDYNNGLCSCRYIDKFALPWSKPFNNIFASRTPSSIPVPSIPKEPSILLSMQDPYSISGIWARVVCFLDYDDLYHFNFNPTATRQPANVPLPPITMDEAIRRIFMKLSVTAITEPGKNDDQSMPVVHFTGVARALDTNMEANANSSIRGCVRMTAEGEVRWSTVWVFNGDEERWRSEAVQVGGIGSKRGVVGIWYDKSLDPHGPAGPTAFWKVRDAPSHEEDEDEVEMHDDEDWMDFPA